MELEVILKMSAVTAVQVVLVVLLWRWLRNRKMTVGHKILIGLIFGCTAVLSTHFGIHLGVMTINVRDLGPLSAGLFFDPVSGIIAGLIGGIERFIAGTYWGVGSYTTISCSVSTCLAGVLSAVLHIYLFKRKRPSMIYAFFMGAVMEVFHMYIVLLTHRDDMSMAFFVVQNCSAPMIIFNAIGLALCSLIIGLIARENKKLLKWKREETGISSQFQFWLFFVTLVIVTLSFLLSYSLQTATAIQNARETLKRASDNISSSSDLLGISDSNIYDFSNKARALSQFQIGSEGSFDMVNNIGYIPVGDHRITILNSEEKKLLDSQKNESFFEGTFFNQDSLCLKHEMEGDLVLLTRLPLSEVYMQRNQQAYENLYVAILLFAVIYILISILAEHIVVLNLDRINQSLDKITKGNLNEEVDVRSSVEFVTLSEDINQMVTALKGYIADAEKRMAKELELAHNIQEASLRRNFDIPDTHVSLYALMDPAREVGGDFYDFYMVSQNRLVLVIADVSGKGVPAALFMMRSKTAFRNLSQSMSSPAEILYKVNNELCEGNDAEMFITAWIGIIDLDTGLMKCANAGHEYPVFKKAGGEFELIKDKHGLVLAAMEGTKFREYDMQFEPGDRLFVYTDGVPEAVNAQMEQYGTDRLVRLLNKLGDTPAREMAPKVREDISEFAGDYEQFDDITMLDFIYDKGEDQ